MCGARNPLLIDPSSDQVLVRRDDCSHAERHVVNGQRIVGPERSRAQRRAVGALAS